MLMVNVLYRTCTENGLDNINVLQVYFIICNQFNCSRGLDFFNCYITKYIYFLPLALYCVEKCRSRIPTWFLSNKLQCFGTVTHLSVQSGDLDKIAPCDSEMTPAAIKKSAIKTLGMFKIHYCLFIPCIFSIIEVPLRVPNISHHKRDDRNSVQTLMGTIKRIFQHAMVGA